MKKSILLIIIALFTSICTATEKKYDRRTATVEAFEKNKEAVVNIASKQQMLVRDSFWSEVPFGVRKVEIPSLGSGFIIDPRGYIITNCHVIDEADDITIIMADGVSKYSARKIALNRETDLAVLKIDAEKPLPTVTLGYSNDIMVGETVLAIGNPFGYNHTLTDGIVSAIHSNIANENGQTTDMIQISAPINPGNSGGPLLNINGELIGVNTKIRKSAEAIGFAIPIDTLREELPAMLNVEKLRQVDFGLKVQDKCEYSPETQNTIVKGLIVKEVRLGSLAEQAGFKTGDLITSYNNKPADCSINFYFDLLEAEYGNNWNIEFVSDNSSKSRQIAMEIRKRPQPDAELLADKLFGVKIKPLTERMMNQYGIYGEVGQPVIVSLEKKSPADIAGLEPGDIITAIDGEQISSIAEFANKLELMPYDTVTKVVIKRTHKRTWNYIISNYEATIKTKSLSDSNNTKPLEL
ncbi:MAG: trypsin-like peptidase domain-containing protein [Sedimentisphaerales bacterium]|nr:trypsin-like peptidase domain-containing protein [Sedimentisphaerales bacterium]